MVERSSGMGVASRCRLQTLLLTADDDAKASRWLGLNRPIHLEVIASPGITTLDDQSHC